MEYSASDVARLGAQLEAIDLGHGERAALDALITFAARRPEEVAGFGQQSTTQRRRLPEVLSAILFEPV